MTEKLLTAAVMLVLGYSLGYLRKKAQGDYEIKLYVHKEHDGKITLCNNIDHG